MLDLFVNRSLYPAAPLQQRVALVTGSYDRTVDGVALTLNRLVGHLVQSGHEVLVLCPAASSSRPALVRHAGAPVQRVPSVPFPVWWEYRLTWGLGGAAAFGEEPLETMRLRGELHELQKALHHTQAALVSKCADLTSGPAE